MKKLKLDKLQLKTTDFLSREQLKHIYGGDPGSGGGGSGINCLIRYYGSDGTWYQSSGPCASATLSECAAYAAAKCANDASMVGGACTTWACA